MTAGIGPGRAGRDGEMTTVSDVTTPEAIEALTGRLFVEGVGAMHMSTLYLGHKLGLYAALVADGPLTAAELASRCAIDEWYAREWLQAEITAGLVLADDENLRQAGFTAAPGVRETLVDETGPAYLGGLPLATAAVGSVLPQLLAAFRTGAGVPYAGYGADAVAAQAALNRPAFVNELVGSWLPLIPDVHARLIDPARPARVADVGCGLGWAAIELATAFPHLHVDGYDSDETSISTARRNAADAGLGDRVTFEVVDAGAADYRGRMYDAVFFFECLHDMAHPAAALRAAGTALAPGGSVIVMDERTSDTIEVGDPVQFFFAAASVLWCLPQARVDADSESPGTVMRTADFRRIAAEAGWTGVDVLPIDHPFWRFYRLAR
jgi:ubiquinone/menaquinone biosynthesis C-methylase UbiE